MTTAQVNYLNIGLMLISAIAAFIIPFELFLFSYAFLGPLHYLTEISWLHKRQYFSPKKYDFIPLILITILIAIPAVFSYIYVSAGTRDPNGNLVLTPSINGFFNFVREENPATALIFMAFAFSMVFILIKDSLRRFIGILLVFIIAILVRTNNFVEVLFAMFLPTLIHVFLFTGAFILLGALKGKSASGYLSMLIFFGCAISFFLIAPNGAGYQISGYAKNSYDVSFLSLNQQIFKSFLHINDPSSDMVYTSSAGILITRFIAYAYTYHYLNWFSKTSIIKWHEISRPWLVIIIVLWLSAVVIYYFNYERGLMILYFLSFLHVILEFPLNWQSFKQIGEQIKLRLRPAPVKT
ncbi:MAG: hypothetical protein ACHQFW_05755 [Chitinophagales bacterium]